MVERHFAPGIERMFKPSPGITVPDTFFLPRWCRQSRGERPLIGQHLLHDLLLDIYDTTRLQLKHQFSTDILMWERILHNHRDERVLTGLCTRSEEQCRCH
jgi:hypothetical protein